MQVMQRILAVIVTSNFIDDINVEFRRLSNFVKNEKLSIFRKYRAETFYRGSVLTKANIL